MDAVERAYLALLRASGGRDPAPQALADAAGVPLEEAAARAQRIRKGRARLAAMLAGDRGIEQRTPAWYVARDGLITASDVAQAIGKGKFVTGARGRDELKWKKIERAPNVDPPPGAFSPFFWGQIFEDVASRLYCQTRDGVAVHDFGLLVHPTEKHVGCSPDGVSELGVMLEIKCPIKRRIVDGEIVEQYLIQMQVQMEVADLDECDFIEVEIDQYCTFSEMEADVARGWDVKGVIASDDADKVHAYSPAGLDAAGLRAWLVERGRDVEGDAWPKTRMWALRKMAVQRVARDRAFWAGIAPQVASFWADVVAGRASGATKPPPAERRSRAKKVSDEMPPFPAALFGAIPVAKKDFVAPEPAPAPAPAPAPSKAAALFATLRRQRSPA